jgi:N6-adenosine-specific RNA methylase IME4
MERACGIFVRLQTGRLGARVTWPFDPLNPFSYDLAMIDPPWPFEVYSERGIAKSPEAHYQTMTMDDIARLPVGDILAPAGVLFCWATWPLIDRQAAIIRRWGLEPKSGGAWAKRTASGKLRWGTGYLLRSVCEPFIIATLPGSGFRGSSEINLIDGLAREHSRKPTEAYEMLERILPNARRADVFARQTRPGWAAFGDQAGKFDAA